MEAGNKRTVAVIVIVVTAVLAYFAVPVFFYEMRNSNYHLFAIVVLAAYAFSKLLGDDLKQIGPKFSGTMWAWILTIMFAIILVPMDAYVDDGFVLSIAIIGMVALWVSLMRNLAGVSIWSGLKKKLPLVIGLAFIYFAIGGGYTVYRWVKFVPEYKTRYEVMEKAITASHKTRSVPITSEELKTETQQRVGPYPIAQNYKAMNLRWFVLWVTSAPAYFFTNIIRDVIDWVWNYLANVLNWFTADQLKDWKK